MRRANNLYPRIADPENLRLAYWKASRGKRHKPDVAAFRADRERNLAGLREELESGRVRVGDYRYFTIRDPKERTICAAPFRERVLHHALINVCEPHFEAYQIDASYACRRGKGVHAALAAAQNWTAAWRYYLKLDVRRYFPSIDHETLLALLARRFKDRRLLDLFRRLVTSHETAPGKGIPIGNLTSQYFANHYLAALDHHAKETLGLRAYLRYMDDVLVWHDDRAALRRAHAELRDFAAQRLGLELKPPVLNACRLGVSALGYRVFPGHVRLQRRSRDRFVAKLRRCQVELEEGTITESQAAMQALPLLAFTQHASTQGLRRRILGELWHQGDAPVAPTG